MVCIYCGNKTQVTNSRAQLRTNAIWRRRQCVMCSATITTTEQVDLGASLRVIDASGNITPFSRDTLFYSIVASCGHRKNTMITDGSALTDTIVRKLVDKKLVLVPVSDIQAISLQTLELFDSASASYYKSYFC